MSESEVRSERPPVDRRGPADRRRYNRRTAPANVSPPYFEVFERIADALEGIEQALTRADRS